MVMMRSLSSAAVLIGFATFESSAGTTCGPGEPSFHYAEEPHWNTLSATSKCSEPMQSPIPITEAEVAVDTSLKPLVLSEDPEAAKDAILTFNDHTWNVAFQEGPGHMANVSWNGKNYTLFDGFHFHSPSEHTLDGKHTDMELHLVHHASDGTHLVLGFFVNIGEENEYFRRFFNLFPTQFLGGPKRIDNDQIVEDIYKSLVPDPASTEYMHYEGSFTTPPCTLQTTWVLVKQPLTLSRAQFDTYREALDHLRCSALYVRAGHTPRGVTDPATWNSAIGINNRLVQNLDGRTVGLFVPGQGRVELPEPASGSSKAIGSTMIIAVMCVSAFLIYQKRKSLSGADTAYEPLMEVSAVA